MLDALHERDRSQGLRVLRAVVVVPAAIGKFVERQLPQYNSAGSLGATDDRCVSLRNPVLQDPGPAGGAYAPGRYVVFDGDGHAVSGPINARREQAVMAFSLFKGVLTAYGDIAIENWVQTFDPVKHQSGERDTRDFSGLDLLRHHGQRRKSNIGFGWPCSFPRAPVDW